MDKRKDGGHGMVFSRAKPGAQEPPTQDWASETVDGKTVYKSRVNSAGVNSGSPSREMDVVVTGNLPEYPFGVQMLSVWFQERSSVAERKATVSVGSQSWSLYRMESTFSFGGMSANTHVRHHVGGEMAEQILSAMSKPSDIVVSAVLVNSPEIDFESQSEASQVEQGFVTQAPQGDYFSQFPPELSQTRPSISPNVGRARANQARREPAEPVLRLESRSTQLPVALESYQACYEEVQPKAK